MGKEAAAKRTALLTGASSGFGFRTALLLARQGWTVYAGFRDPSAAGPLLAVTREALPLMRTGGGGRIVLVGSVSGRIGFPGLGPYCASKHALEGIGETLRLELAAFGIAVCIVEPGPYKTPIWRKSMAAIRPPSPDSPYAALYGRIRPMLENSAANGGDPNRVAETIVRALTDNKPKLRYLPGRGVRLTILAKTFLPWGVIERAALRALGVKR